MVTRITRTLSDGAFHEPLHVNPARASWETILFEEPWRVDGSVNDMASGFDAASMTALAYNLRRVLNLVGFAELMAAVAA